MLDKSADATHRFQPFQPSSELVEKVDQPNQPKDLFARPEIKLQPAYFYFIARLIN